MCLLTNEDINILDRIFIRSPGSCMPQGLGLGGAGGQKFNLLNMVMWHIKLKGMSSRPEYTGDLRWRAIECVLVYNVFPTYSVWTVVPQKFVKCSF